LLKLATRNREILQLLGNSFPDGEFEGVTLSWNPAGLSADGVAEGYTLVGHLEIPASEWDTFQFELQGHLCLFTKHLTPLLTHVLAARSPDASINASFVMESEKSMKADIVVEHWGRRLSTLQHVPDKLLPGRPKTDFGGATRLEAKPHELMKITLSAMAPAKMLGIRLDQGGILVTDPGNPMSQFIPMGINASGTAHATYLVPSIANAIAVCEKVDPQSSVMEVTPKGLARIAYVFKAAVLEYLIAPVIESS
jgi:hypothetical protein